MGLGPAYGWDDETISTAPPCSADSLSAIVTTGGAHSTVPHSKVSRPLLRYHGGKFMLGPWIISHFPSHRIYTETFGGAASVLLQKPRCYAEVYNDLDSELVNLFTVVRERGPELRQALHFTPYSRFEFDLSYEVSSDPLEQARRTIVRSLMGFGSNAHNRARGTGFRANSNRSSTTPALDWRNYPEALAGTIERLRGVILENRDALAIIAQHDSVETLHYIDPPYPLSSRTDSQPDYRHEMTDADHKQLASFLKTVAGMVVISGYPGPLYDRLFKRWHRVERQALADGARPRIECLWLNAAAWDRLKAEQTQKEFTL